MFGLAALTKNPFACRVAATSEEMFFCKAIPTNKPDPRTSETPEIELMLEERYLKSALLFIRILFFSIHLMAAIDAAVVTGLPPKVDP